VSGSVCLCVSTCVSVCARRAGTYIETSVAFWRTESGTGLKASSHANCRYAADYVTTFPPEAELKGTVVDNVKAFIDNAFKGSATA
jgi:hypothetical protein